jgi:hypothetical protein
MNYLAGVRGGCWLAGWLGWRLAGWLAGSIGLAGWLVGWLNTPAGELPSCWLLGLSSKRNADICAVPAHWLGPCRVSLLPCTPPLDAVRARGPRGVGARGEWVRGFWGGAPAAGREPPET